jgi:[NiFe] hydrogenase assembly HybE family chaperone
MSERVEVAQRELVAAYCEIDRRRGRDMPFYNERLGVEAVGFQAWDGHVIGVLITPWFMNLMLLPGESIDRATCTDGDVREWQLPSGKYRFVAGLLEGPGVCFSAALFTTVEVFPDQATARAVATEVMTRILADHRDRDSLGEADIVAGTDVLRQPVSRRGLLRRLALKQD